MSSRNKKIFVIDDSKTALEFASLCLTEAGFEVFTYNGPFGIPRETRKHNPDLILVDVSMPALDGDKLVPVIRDMKAPRPTLVLLYSMRTEQELLELMVACGADGYVKKSTDPDDLIAAIERHLTGRKL